MTAVRTLLYAFSILWLASAFAAPAIAQDDSGTTGPQPRTPIKHFVTLMQSNHTFDSYFGTYPGADGVPTDACMPVDPTDPTNDGCVEPFHLENYGTDLTHTFTTFRNQYRSGSMDGFVHAFRLLGEDGTVAMGHYDDQDLPFYWNLADEYVLFDRFFTSAAGGSTPNRMFWATGTAGITRPGSEDVPEAGWGDLPTIFDRLEERGISWKVYVQNYDPSIILTEREDGVAAPAQFKWVPVLGFSRFIDDPQLSSHIVDLEEFFHDVQDGDLPAVSYVVTVGASEHPPSNLLTGQRLVKRMLNVLMQSPLWDDSAFLMTWDDWGGWYDHVPPPQVDEFGYGFRTPALLVSPYAKQGHVDSTVLDFTSILRFIEDNYDLPALAERDASANSLMSAFDFTGAPREPRIIAMTRGEVSVPQPRRSVIYGFYTAAVLIPIAIISAALARPWFGGHGIGFPRILRGRGTREARTP
jgi:phospholipase C